MTEVERLHRVATREDGRVQFGVGQHAIVRQPGLFDKRRHPVEHPPLLVQRGEVQHHHARRVGETEHG